MGGINKVITPFNPKRKTEVFTMNKITDSAIFNYEFDDRFLVEKLSAYVDEHKDDIYSFFNMKFDNTKPIINIIAKKEELDNIHRRFNDLKDTDEVPKWIVGLSASDMQIYYLSLNDYNSTSHAFKKEDYEIQLEMYKKTILHEYVHYVNRLFCKKNNCSYSIKCLSEGIAQYLSNQKNNSAIQFNYSLNEILTSNNCYNGWYLVTKYIIENYSHELVLELLKDKNEAEKFITEKYEEIKKYYTELKQKNI